MNNNGKGLLMSWPRYVEGTTSISRLMHKQTYLTFVNYYRNYYIINYYIDHRLPDCRQWHAMYTAFKFITNRLILHKVRKIKLHVHTVIYMIISPTCSTSASREQHNKFDLLFNQTSVIQINKYSKPRVNYSKRTVLI